MFGVGMGELVIVVLAIFLLFGPEALPEIAKTIGQFLAKVRDGLQEFEKDIAGRRRDS